MGARLILMRQGEEFSEVDAGEESSTNAELRYGNSYVYLRIYLFP